MGRGFDGAAWLSFLLLAGLYIEYECQMDRPEPAYAAT